MITIHKSSYILLMDHVSDMIFVMKVTEDNNFMYEYLNETAKALSNYNTDLIGKTIQEANTKHTAELLYERYENTLATKEVTTYQDMYVASTKKTMYSDISLIPLLDDNENCTHIVAVIKDITSKVEITQKLEESKEHLEIIIENVADLVVLINSEKNVIFTSPSYTKVLGLTQDEVIGNSYTKNIHADDIKVVNESLNNAIENGEAYTVEFRRLNDKNEWSWLQAYGTPVLDEQGKFKHMVIVTRDINKQKEYQCKLKHLAMHDPLTNLPNRRHFNEQLTEALTYAKKQSITLALLLLDIDRFKSINDQFGHDIGDKVIQEFGRRLQSVSYDHCTVARLGGDEFAILLPNLTENETAIDLAKSVKRIMSQPWDDDGTLPIITTSIGISMPESMEVITEHKFMKAADVALYEAKHAGRNTYKISLPINT